jgi:hypothetical protein
MEVRLRLDAGGTVKFVIRALLLVVIVAGCGTSKIDKEKSDLATEDSVTVDIVDNLQSFDWGPWQQPDREYGPWIRWWWPGTDVDDKELEREVGVLADAGFAGAEIQPIKAGLNPDATPEEMARRLAFDTPKYYAHLAAVLSAGAKTGLAIDVTLGSGWPTGGSFVSESTAMRTLLWSEQQVEGPATVQVGAAEPETSISYLIAQTAQGFGEPVTLEWTGDQAVTVAVLAAKVTGGVRDPNPLVLDDVLNLDFSSLVDLTSKLSAESDFVWEVPAGTWQIMTFYEAPDGQFVKFASEGALTRVINHFDSALVTAALEHLLRDPVGLEQYLGDGLSGFFVDSFELSTERHFSADFLAEFQARRGYDLRPYLPLVVLPGADNHMIEASGITTAAPFAFDLSTDAGIRHDYQQTVSDLFIERFVQTSTAWAEARGMTFRLQPYGIKVDVIKAAGLASIPEAEQLYAAGSDIFLKAISSGAHLYGRNVVSAESMVWPGAVFMTTPLKIKAAADKLYAAGINRLLLHGFPYRKMEDDYGDPGWHPFCSPFAGAGFTSHFGESNSMWEFMPDINRYLSRIQFVLQQGRSDADLLVYYPFLGFPAAIARLDSAGELLFGGAFPGQPEVGGNALFDLLSSLFGDMGDESEARWLESVRPVLRDLSAAGYTWDWVNAESLVAMKVVDGGIVIREQPYRGILLLDSPWLEADAAQQIKTGVLEGLAVIVAGVVPEHEPGLGSADIAGMLSGCNITTMSDLPSVLATLLQPAVGITMFETDSTPVAVVRRVLGPEQSVTFVSNPAPKTTIFDLHFAGGCEQALAAAAWTGSFYELSMQPHEDTGQTVTIALSSFGSLLVFCGVPPPDDATIAPANDIWSWTELKGWDLQVVGADVAGGIFEQEVADWSDWREILELKYAGTTGIYESIYNDTDEQVGEAFLTVKKIDGAARVKVNGTHVGNLLVPPFVVPVGTNLRQDDNTITIELIPVLRNRYVGYAQDGNEAYKHYSGLEDALAPTGVFGPVGIGRE